MSGTRIKNCVLSRNSESGRLPSREPLNQLIARLSVTAPWHVPLIRAMRDGTATLAVLNRECGRNAKKWKALREPTIVLINDDDSISTGPGGWPGIEKVRRWALAAFLHSAAGEPHHYIAALRLATAHRRLALIETDTAHVEAWREWASGIIAGEVACRPAERHPAVIARECLQ